VKQQSHSTNTYIIVVWEGSNAAVEFCCNLQISSFHRTRFTVVAQGAT